LGKQETGRARTHLFGGLLLGTLLRGPKALIQLLQVLKGMHIDYTIVHKGLLHYFFELLVLTPDIEELLFFLFEFLLQACLVLTQVII
jgi:hypothetical protein